jgi:hypothetical protein
MLGDDRSGQIPDGMGLGSRINPLLADQRANAFGQLRCLGRCLGSRLRRRR